MIKKLSIFLFFFITVNLFGQIPGYAGKRFTIGYSNMLSPNFITGNLDLKYNRSVLTHSVNVNYIISKQREVCASLRFNNRKIFHYNYLGFPIGNTVETIEKLSSLEYCFGFRRFNKSKFAPLGAYSKWEGIFITSWMNYQPYLTLNDDISIGSSPTISHEGREIKFKSIGVIYTRGRQRVFLDKLVVDYGIKGMLIYVYNDDSGYNRYAADLASRVSNSLSLVPILNGFLGIGFLAF